MASRSASGISFFTLSTVSTRSCVGLRREIQQQVNEPIAVELELSVE